LTEPAQQQANLKVVFATSRVHARDRLAYWREEAGKAYVAHEFSTSMGRAFQGIIRAGTLGTLELALFSCDQCAVDRTVGCLKSAYDDELLIGLQVKGRMALHQDGRDAVTAPGDVFLLDPRRPFSFDVYPGIQSLAVKVPRWELQARLGDVSALTARPISNRRPEAALASSFLSLLVERADAIGEPAAGKIAQQALDLVALAFEASIPQGRTQLSSSRTTTLLRLKAIIEAKLHDPTLKPMLAAAAAGISVRYANALLAQEGTSLERFIMRRRLQHCRRSLEDAAQLHRPVSDIAYACGFSDVSHFTRRFKAEFGCSPSECRSRAGALRCEDRLSSRGGYRRGA
jgi:AraC family transcriptional regulator, positive regulator of tynA and feaB